MINTAPPTSNSVHGREKWFKYNKFRVTIFRGCVAQWSWMYASLKDDSEGASKNPGEAILSNIAHFFSF